MGQVIKKNDSNLSTTPPIDVPKNNGSVLCNIYIPDELLTMMLSYADMKTIAKCKTVCKKWCRLIKNGVWKMKAERENRKIFEELNLQKRLPWGVYHSIIWKKSFGRNLLKNDNGQDGLSHWYIMANGGNAWIIEHPPVGVKGVEEPEKYSYAFATSYGECKKKQVVDFYQSGLTAEILDKYQPDIVISESYAARWDCDSHYRLDVELLNKEKEVVQKFHFHTDLQNWKDGWKEIKHTFHSYGPGVKFLSFCHTGVDSQFWAGHYGSKMTGARVEVPYYVLNKMQITNNENNEGSQND